jgi:predicted dehydrogenase
MRSYPTAVTAKATTLGDFDTEDNLSCTLSFPTGVATAHLTWTAGTRRVLYTLHGTNGSIIVDDDNVQLLRDSSTNKGADLPASVNAPSHWIDASHKEWFSSLLDDFRNAVDTRQWISKDTIDAIACMNTISAAYGSADVHSAEIAIPDPVQQLRALSAPMRVKKPLADVTVRQS